MEDESHRLIYKGKLWKLNSGSDPIVAKNWLIRDMWIADNGSLCYFSQREDKRLVMFDGHQMHDGEITKLTGLAKPHAFQLTIHSSDRHTIVSTFACDTAAELE